MHSKNLSPCKLVYLKYPSDFQGNRYKLFRIEPLVDVEGPRRDWRCPTKKTDDSRHAQLRLIHHNKCKFSFYDSTIQNILIKVWSQTKWTMYLERLTKIYFFEPNLEGSVKPSRWNDGMSGIDLSSTCSCWWMKADKSRPEAGPLQNPDPPSPVQM